MSRFNPFDWWDFAGIRFLILEKKLRQERMQKLKERGLTIELEDIVVGPGCVVIETNIWRYGQEYWLLSRTDRNSDKITFDQKKVEGSRLAIYVDSGQLICRHGVPLKPGKKNSKLLLELGIEPRLYFALW
jgi:hypothetical protein